VFICKYLLKFQRSFLPTSSGSRQLQKNGHSKKNHKDFYIGRDGWCIEPVGVKMLAVGRAISGTGRRVTWT
jgi:hypothetical protein